MQKTPVIAIVGRPNVGKSSLLNALVGKRISIVQDMPGVTRDRISAYLGIDIGTHDRPDVRYVELVDTGGYGFNDPDLSEHIKHQIELAMARADLVMFIVDTHEGRTTADEEIAALLRRKNIRALLIANKADGERLDPMLGDFARLGLGTPLGVSATNDRNLDDLAAAIKGRLNLKDAPTEIPEPEMMVAIVGKRNAGKSTLVNAIAKIYEGEEDRVIVSEVPGTTRDSVDVRFEKEGKVLTVIDTAGVRKKRHMVTNDIEFYSFHRAERSIRRADVVMLLIDATEPVSEPDKKLAQYVAEHFKPCVIIVNKWDLAKKKLAEQRKEGQIEEDDRVIMEEYREYLDEELKMIDFAPMAFVTAKDGKNVQAALDLAQHLHKQALTRVTTGKLNQLVRGLLQERTPSTPSGRKAKVFYVTQIDVQPPSIVLVVNNPDFIDETYQRFMLNRLREALPFGEVPIKLVIRARGQRAKEAALDELSEEEAGTVEMELPGDRPARPSMPPHKRPAPKQSGPKRPSSSKSGKRPPRGGGSRRGKAKRRPGSR